MAAIERARAAAEAQLEAASELTKAHLAATFESEEARTWEKYPISDLTETGSGSTPSRSRQEYYSGTIPWVKTGELRDGTVEDTEEHVSDAALKETSLRLLPPGTLLVAMYGQGQTRGRTAVLGVAATTNQACFAILPNSQRFNPLFLQAWFKYSYQRLRDESEGRGGNQPNMNGVILRAEKVPLPDLETQSKIADELAAKASMVWQLTTGLREQLSFVETLPSLLLRQTFSGAS